MHLTPDMRRRIGLSALLLIATVAVFWPAHNYPFVRYDDPVYVRDNPHVTSGLTGENIAWAFKNGYASNWHPVTWISHMLDVQLFGMNPGWHHLTNVLFHAANALLLFLMLDRATRALWRSFAVAALFALHPLHVESVAWIAERKDVLSTFFLMVTLLAYGAYARNTGTSRRARYYLLALVLFALGLMSKPMLVTVPFALLLVDWWPLRRLQPATGTGESGPASTASVSSQAANPAVSGHTALPLLGPARRGEDTHALPLLGPARRGEDTHALPSVGEAARVSLLLVEKVPFLLLALGSSVITFLVQEQAQATTLVLPVASRIANAIAAYAKYLGKTLWPTDLSVFYPHPDTRYPASEQWPWWGIALALACLLALSGLALWKARRAPWLASGWFWYLGTLVPVLGLIQVGMQAMADRYTYIPLIGIFVCVVWAVAEVAARVALKPPVLAGTTALVLLACAVLSLRQLGYWRDTLTLFEHALAVTRDNAVAHCYVGIEYGERGQADRAIGHFQAAIKAARSIPDSWFGLGYTYELQGKFAEAIEPYREALKLRPNNEWYRTRLATTLINAGGQLWSAGKRDEAQNDYAEATRLEPGSPVAHYNLGTALLAKDDAAAAATEFREAARLNPQYVEAFTGLGRALNAQSKSAEALASFQEALRTRRDPFTLLHLGITQRALRRPAEAIASFREALRLRPDWPNALAELAWTLATSSEAQSRNGTEALELALKACLATGSTDPRALSALDAAYAELGRWDEALRTVAKVKQIAETSGDKPTAAEAAKRAEFYRKQEPFRD